MGKSELVGTTLISIYRKLCHGLGLNWRAETYVNNRRQTRTQFMAEIYRNLFIWTLFEIHERMILILIAIFQYCNAGGPLGKAYKE